MAAILNSAILNLAILDSAILVFPLKLTHTCQDWFPPFAQKKHSVIHSDSTWWWQPSWILPCWIQTLPSWIQTPSYLLSDSLKNTLPPLWLLIQTNSIWLKLIHSHSTLWWQPSWILPSWIWILDSAILVFLSNLLTLARLVPTICTKKPSLIHSDSIWWGQPSWILPCWIKKTSLIHSDSTWWWQSSWILPCWIQTPCFLLSDSLKNTLTPLWLWLKLIQSDSNLFILTQLDDGSHLEFCHLEFHHLGFSHLSFSSQTHSQLPRLVPTICTKKKPSLIHSDSTWWWQPSWILPCWIQTLPSWIQTPSYLLSDSLKNTLPPLWFLTQTNSIWLKLIHSDSTWWWQPSWILPSWFCFHLGFSHFAQNSDSN